MTTSKFNFIADKDIANWNAIPAEVREMLEDKETVIEVAFSGGKDSVALVLRLLELGVSEDRIILHHHDVDGEGEKLFDWACTLSYCDAFAEAFGMTIVHSGREGGIIREVLRKEEWLQNIYYYGSNGERIVKESKRVERYRNTKLMWPAVAADLGTRWCSAVAKIDVMSGYIAHRYGKGAKVLILTGERREESPKRSSYKEWEYHKTNTKSRKVIQWRGVIDFSEQQVWDLFQEWSVQPHPCYMLGWGRCSCLTCIFSSSDTWASIYQIAPQRVERIAGLEPKLGKNGEGHTIYTTKMKEQARDEDTGELMFYKNGNPVMRSKIVPLYIMDKVQMGTSFIKPDNLQRWGKEATSTFTSPIFVTEWVMPAGAFGEQSCGSI